MISKIDYTTLRNQKKVYWNIPRFTKLIQQINNQYLGNKLYTIEAKKIVEALEIAKILNDDRR